MKEFATSTVLTYLRLLAKRSLKKHNPTIIGIAGSVGKSSTRNALEAILKDHFPTLAVGNSETGVPLGILGMKPDDYTKKDWITMLAKAPFQLNHLRGIKFLIAEMGIDDPYPPKNMDYLLTILHPDIAISLNVSATHSMQFDKTVSAQDMSEAERLTEVVRKIAEEDTKIITMSGCTTGIYNADDDSLTACIESFAKSAAPTSLISFGTKNANDISYGLYTVDLHGSSFHYFVKENGTSREITIAPPHVILPRGYREVFGAAILAALQTGLRLDQIKTSLEKNLSLPKGRASILPGINNSIIIDSTYNASKTATTAFLDLVDTLKKESGRKVVFVFGDMRELGEESHVEHAAVAEKLLGIVDYLYCVGPQTREFVLPIIQEHEDKLKEIRWFDNATRVGEFLKEHMPKDALVLVKGSQNTIYLEEAIKQILKDKKDEANLCRQSEYWMKIKNV